MADQISPASSQEDAAGAHEDSSPALATVAPTYDADSALDSVDLSDMPSIKELTRMLPADRFDIKCRAGEIGEMLPDEWADEDGEIDSSSIESGSIENLQIMRKMMVAVQEFVLDMAEDRQAMTI